MNPISAVTIVALATVVIGLSAYCYYMTKLVRIVMLTVIEHLENHNEASQ